MALGGLFRRREKITTSRDERLSPGVRVDSGNGRAITGRILLSNNINVYSEVLSIPDVVYNIVMNLAGSRFIRLDVEGSVEATLDKLASRIAPLLEGPGPYYLYAGSGDGVSIRSLIYNGRIVAFVLEEGRMVHKGVEALEHLARLRGSYNASIGLVKTRIVEWSPEYSVSIPVLDKQHATFFEIINSIFESMVTGLFEDRGDNIMRQLRMYTQGHFTSEERIMEKYHYPEDLYEDHRKHHNLFRGAVDSYYEEYNTGNRVAVAARLFEVTRTWLRDHILGVDKKYEEYFKMLGIKVEA